jgi:hypothetical protein
MSGSANAGTTAERHQMRELKILTKKVRALASAWPRVFFLDRRLTWMSVSGRSEHFGAGNTVLRAGSMLLLRNRGLDCFVLNPPGNISF